MYNDIRKYCRENVKILARDNDFIVRACIDCDFDRALIMEKISLYERTDKYAGIKEYEW